MMAFFTVVLAVIHGLAGLAILIVSSWFIAACAIATPGFNYMLPAVVIRGLALLRIGSGYAHMWVGHKHLLGLTAFLRLQLFERLQSHTISSRSEEVEALASHTEAIAAIWVGWVSQQASAVMMLLVSSISLWWLRIPLGGWAIVLAVLWLLVMLLLCWLGLTYAEKIAEEEQEFRQLSEAQLASAPIWHLKPADALMAAMPKAMSLWRSNLLLQQRVMQAQWLFQGGAWLLLLASLLGLVHTASDTDFAEPLLLIVPMLLLSAGDWLGRSYGTQPALNRAVQGNKVVSKMPAHSLPSNQKSVAPSDITLTDFGSANLPDQRVSTVLPTQGMVWIIGPSGTGKSQLLQAIAGLVDSHGTRQCTGHSLGPGLIHGWLYLEQHPIVLAATLKHNLCMGQSVREVAIHEALSEAGLSHLVELGEWLGPGGRQLSGGERKRLNIARAILHDGPVWLVDEPFEGLDADAINRLMALLTDIAQNKLVVIASHVVPDHDGPSTTIIL